jgi:phosphate-selective porin OprO/OprP
MKTQNNLLTSILLTAGIISSPIISYAADSKELEDLRAQVEELKQAVKVLDRKGEIVAEEAAAKKKETPILRAGSDGFGWKSADGKNEIKLRGLAHLDYRSYNNDEGNFSTSNDGFTFRRIRPTIAGTVNGIYDFQFTPEFGESKTSSTTSTTGIVDAFVNAKFKPWFQVRAGKFKPFVGLERLQSGGDIKFLERSYVSNNFAPNRDLGLAIHGDIFDGRLNYALGIHNGVVDGGDNTTSIDTNGSKDFAFRVFATPFKNDIGILNGLGFGIAATRSNFGGALLPSYKTPGQSTFYSYASNVVADGARTRFVPQAYYYLGPLGVIAEYATVNQDVKKASGTGAGTKLEVDNLAWQIAASYLLTGEDASFKGVKPKNDFNLDGAGWGAWELVARYERADIDNDLWSNSIFTTQTTGAAASVKSASSWAAGLNWYLNQNIKIALNYEQTSFEGGNVTNYLLDHPDEKILSSRLQLSY